MEDRAPRIIKIEDTNICLVNTTWLMTNLLMIKNESGVTKAMKNWGIKGKRINREKYYPLKKIEAALGL
jgi:hypothetical protein